MKKLKLNNWYYQGVEARRCRQSKDVNPYPKVSKQGAWWLAGWHDQDQEGDVQREPLSS